VDDELREAERLVDADPSDAGAKARVLALKSRALAIMLHGMRGYSMDEVEHAYLAHGRDLARLLRPMDYVQSVAEAVGASIRRRKATRGGPPAEVELRAARTTLSIAPESEWPLEVEAWDDGSEDPFEWSATPRLVFFLLVAPRAVPLDWWDRATMGSACARFGAEDVVARQGGFDFSLRGVRFRVDMLAARCGVSARPAAWPYGPDVPYAPVRLFSRSFVLPGDIVEAASAYADALSAGRCADYDEFMDRAFALLPGGPGFNVRSFYSREASTVWRCDVTAPEFAGRRAVPGVILGRDEHGIVQAGILDKYDPPIRWGFGTPRELAAELSRYWPQCAGVVPTA